jgi:hypothetical protein
LVWSPPPDPPAQGFSLPDRKTFLASEVLQEAVVRNLWLEP